MHVYTDIENEYIIVFSSLPEVPIHGADVVLPSINSLSVNICASKATLDLNG